MTSARFTLDGDPYNNRGYVAEQGATVVLALESGGASTCTVRVSQTSKAADPIPELATEVVLDPPTADLELTIPTGIHSWRIEVVVNGGIDANGRRVAGYVASRIISTVTEDGLRKMVVAERDEFDPVYGWCGAQNDQIAVAAGGFGGADALAGLDVVAEYRADRGIERGWLAIGRWLDQRGYAHWIQHERSSEYTCRTPLRFDDDAGDGLPVVATGGSGSSLWSRTPLGLRSLEEFSIALRVYFSAATNQTILSIGGGVFPGSTVDAPTLLVSWAYTAGPTGTLTFDVKDGDEVSVQVTATITHSAWHTVILRATNGTRMSVRVDGVDGDDEAILFADLTVEHAGLACVFNAIDGSIDGVFSSRLRHIVIADSEWDSSEAATVEAHFTDLWT